MCPEGVKKLNSIKSLILSDPTGRPWTRETRVNYRRSIVYADDSREILPHQLLERAC